MTTNEIIGSILIVLFLLWIVYEVRNAPEMDE